MHAWLTVIVVLLIIGILLDGWRRMRNARRDTIRMARKPQRPSAHAQGDEGYTSELPNGGARVVPKRDRMAHPDDEPEATGTSARIPQQVALNLDESVPMLMESVEERTEPVIAENLSQNESLEEGLRREPSFSALEPESDLDFEPEPEYESEYGSEFEPEPVSELEPELEEEQVVMAEPEPFANEANTDSSAPEMPDEVIIINVMAPPGDYFQGDELLDALLQNGMRFGDMEIFHRHQEANGQGPILFSLANMVKPGTFDLDNMDDFQTPGVSLFLTLPLKSDSLRAFDLMRDIAQSLCELLDAELKDENRSVMTRQTMEHCRQRITDYQRRRLSRAAT